MAKRVFLGFLAVGAVVAGAWVALRPPELPDNLPTVAPQASAAARPSTSSDKLAACCARLTRVPSPAARARRPREGHALQ